MVLVYQKFVGFDHIILHFSPSISCYPVMLGGLVWGQRRKTGHGLLGGRKRNADRPKISLISNRNDQHSLILHILYTSLRLKDNCAMKSLF